MKNNIGSLNNYLKSNDYNNVVFFQHNISGIFRKCLLKDNIRKSGKKFFDKSEDWEEVILERIRGISEYLKMKSEIILDIKTCRRDLRFLYFLMPDDIEVYFNFKEPKSGPVLFYFGQNVYAIQTIDLEGIDTDIKYVDLELLPDWLKILLNKEEVKHEFRKSRV